MAPSVKGPVRGGGWSNSGRGRHASGWWRMMCLVSDGVGLGVGNWFDDNTRRVVGNGRILSFGLINCWMEHL